MVGDPPLIPTPAVLARQPHATAFAQGLTNASWRLGLDTYAQHKAADLPIGVIVSEDFPVREPPSARSWAAPAKSMSAGPSASSPRAGSPADGVTVPCFSMAQPFAALLLNGIKYAVHAPPCPSPSLWGRCGRLPLYFQVHSPKYHASTGPRPCARGRPV